MAVLPKEKGCDVEGLILGRYRRIEEYTPVVPLEVLAERAGITVDQVIKLDGNENPYGCSPRVQQALAAFQHYHIYPDPEHRDVRPLLAEYVGVGQEHILASSGSDELIDLVVRLFIEPGDQVINCVPTFGMYEFVAQIFGGEVVALPRRDDFGVDVEAVLRAIGRRTKLIFVASPNNPTGNLTPVEDILALLETGKVVVVDEAYAEFSGRSVASLVPDHDNLVVLRTFSKWAGLAGLRAGYGIFPLPIIKHLWKIKQPYNVNVAALIAIRESFADIEYLRATNEAMVKERERLIAMLAETGIVDPWPSAANFVYCPVLRGDARWITEELARRGIFIRYFDKPLLKNSIRVSVGRPEQTDRLIAALREIGEQLGE